MDTIMSPHTRSLYACVGESTQAYQSPSKDLTAINNRLNNRYLLASQRRGVRTRVKAWSEEFVKIFEFELLHFSMFALGVWSQSSSVCLVSCRCLGRLDFNGTALVSDSLVAGSLYSRSANHHSIRLNGQLQPPWAMVAPLPPSPMKRGRSMQER